MKRTLIAIGVTIMSTTALAEPTMLYVAPDGSDSWSGTMAAPSADGSDGPLATLAGARDAIRALADLPDGGVTVRVRGGDYFLDEAFALSAEDSGKSGAPIAYIAEDDSEVRLLGGKVMRDFAPVTDPAVLARIDEAAREHVLEADLKAVGITDFGSPGGGGMELFFAGKPMTPARWPNEGFARIVDIVVDDGHQIHGRKGSKVGKFVYAEDRPARWVDEPEPRLHGYWFWDWSEQRHRVASIDTDQRVIEVEEPYHGYGYSKGQWYYAYNLLPELDAPAEWYVDRESGVLYFWPPAPISTGETYVSVAGELVRFENVSHVTFERFTLEGARGTAMVMRGGESNVIAGCTIRNVGGGAISIAEGKGHGVVGCDIYQTGKGGIALKGGDRTTLTPAGHYAENNHVHDYARVQRVYAPGITLHGVGNRASHNLIHNAPHMGMGFGGNDHVIEFNEIHSVCYESNDAGAIYTGRNWTMRGHVIRHNYLHHITGFENKGCVGVYLDDMFSSADIIGNVFYKVTRAAFIGGGRDCNVVNNLFVACEPALHVDARALGWAHGHADEWIKEGGEKGTISGMAYDKPPYSERYPELPGILDDEPKAPKGNLIARNAVFGGKWDDIEDKARKYLDMRDNWIGDDPEVVKKAEAYVRTRQVTLALPADFESIPIERIGLYEDAQRASWPVTHTVREP
jgi:parallel beta helix pectate lyase-like protein